MPESPKDQFGKSVRSSSYPKEDDVRVIVTRTDMEEERSIYDSKIPSNLSDDDATIFGFGLAFENGWCPGDIEMVILRTKYIIFEGEFH